jgi:hypothetical protein
MATMLKKAVNKLRKSFIMPPRYVVIATISIGNN